MAASRRAAASGAALKAALARTLYRTEQMIPNPRPKQLFAKDITGTIVAHRQQVDVQWRGGTLLIDEPLFNGGQDLGPDPFTMIVAGLIGCTLTTLRMYVRRKEWNVEDIEVRANMMQEQEPFRTIIRRTIVVGQPITEEQHEKLLYIAKNCPVARLLEGKIVIETDLNGHIT